MAKDSGCASYWWVSAPYHALFTTVLLFFGIITKTNTRMMYHHDSGLIDGCRGPFLFVVSRPPPPQKGWRDMLVGMDDTIPR